MLDDIERVLIPRQDIQRRVAELADDILRDHLPAAPTQRPEITMVPILTGAMIFCCDLMRHIPIAMKVGLVTVSSYPGVSVQTQGSTVLARQLRDIRDRHVLLVDDILDSGGTLRAVQPMLRELGAATVRTCVLLRKNRPEARATPVDYVGFDIPDEFVVGYGLDFDDYYRNLPDVVTLKRQLFDKAR
jgi:hypoxanthine phosphoribosyltransferase